MRAAYPIDGTHAQALKSWVESANTPQTDFPIQNLPYGRFRLKNDAHWRIGVAIGDQVLDLCATGLTDLNEINQLIGLDKSSRLALRQAISTGLQQGSDKQLVWSKYLYLIAEVELGLPCDIRDFTDFYIGIHHATAIGKLFRPDHPLLPNYKYVPIGYHGRASSIIPSGKAFTRPSGQTKTATQDQPTHGPSQRLDFELEMGVVIGRANTQGEPISLDNAEDHIFGLTLLNDWSARDIQAWEYQPLGPFLSKNFASTISPWIITMEALAPFRKEYVRPAGDPQLIPYLDSERNMLSGAVDADLEVLLQTVKMRQDGNEPERISNSNLAHAAYWTIAQLVAHHTVNGCNLNVADLFGTGTLSGPQPEQAGSMLELSKGGNQAFELKNGESRIFLQDGDTIILRGSCTRAGFQRIGFGECTGTVIAKASRRY